MRINYINIVDEHNYAPPFMDKIQTAFDLFAKHERHLEEPEVSLIIVKNNEIQGLNKEYRNKDVPTDVLSFPVDQSVNEITGECLLGDIYISFEKVEQQAKDYDHTLEREWLYLFVHGLYHLIGYDHLTDNDERNMDDKVEKILTEMRVNK